ncbi:hypothetical protein V8D89_000733 [Ganoderma adspersum]
MHVHELPNEILIQVFLRHNALYSASEGIPRRAYACDGAKLMLVCRHWRELAVSTRCLWQAIKVRRNTEWFKLVLSRSGDLPLDLVFHQSTSALVIVNCVVLLIPYLHRLRSMFMPAIKIRRRELEAIFGLSMPLLDDLEVLAKSDGLLDLSPERLPSLRSLRLSSCAIPWIPTMLPKLRRLDLQECTCKDSSVTFDQLLDVLSECVDLRELRLHNFFSALQGPSTTPAPGNRNPAATVSFPHLRELSIQDRPHLLSYFLSYVRLSPTTDVRIIGDILDATADTTGAFLSLLPEDTSGLPLLRTVTFVEIQNWYGCELVGHTGWPWVGPSITLGLELGAALRVPTLSFYLESALREFSSIFARAPVEHLNILGEYKRVRRFDAWTRLFTAFPTIQHLELEGKHAPIPVIAALGQPPYDEAGLDADSEPVTAADGIIDDVGMHGPGILTVLPNLCSLSLECVDWCPGLIETVAMVLQRRLEAGLPKLEDLRLNLTETRDDRGWRRTMKVYRGQLVSLVENLEDPFSD